jgi:hypothetical protein
MDEWRDFLVKNPGKNIIEEESAEETTSAKPAKSTKDISLPVDEEPKPTASFIASVIFNAILTLCRAVESALWVTMKIEYYFVTAVTESTTCTVWILHCPKSQQEHGTVLNVKRNKKMPNVNNKKV